MECTAVVKHCGDWWIGWIAEVPGVNCQERTREELLRSLAGALAEARPDAPWTGDSSSIRS